jgi:hypothetical protein
MVKFNRKAASTSLNDLTMDNAVDLGIDNKSDLSNGDKSDDQNNECRGIYGWGISHAWGIYHANYHWGMHYANYDGSICKDELDEYSQPFSDPAEDTVWQNPDWFSDPAQDTVWLNPDWFSTSVDSNSGQAEEIESHLTPCHWPSLSTCHHYEIHHYQNLHLMFCNLFILHCQ